MYIQFPDIPLTTEIANEDLMLNLNPGSKL